MNKINIKVNKAQLVLLISKEQPTIYKDYEYLIYKKVGYFNESYFNDGTVPPNFTWDILNLMGLNEEQLLEIYNYFNEQDNGK